MRRTILSLLCCLLFLSPGTAAAQLLPIIDLHFHFIKGRDIDPVVKQMNALGVAKAGNGSRVYSDTVALDWARRYPNRFIPFAVRAIEEFMLTDGGCRLQAPGVLAYLEQLDGTLKTGQFKGIGEIHQAICSADSPLMQRLWGLSATYRVPVDIHAYPHEKFVGEMERLLASDRRGALVWAHAGRPARPALLRRLLRAHPNLYTDLAGRISDMDDLEWKVLLEEFSDRFVLGSDGLPLPDFVGSWRKVLKQLSPPTARKLAHQNAERLLNPGR